MKLHSGVARTESIAVVVLVVALYSGLVLADITGTFFMLGGPGGADVSHWEIQMGFSFLVGWMYLAVGVLVFLYLRQRLLGGLVLAFCSSMAVSFALETSAILSPDFLNSYTVIADAGSTMALYLFDVLLLLFPHNFFAETRKRSHFRLLYGYLAAITGVAVFLLVGNFDSAVNITLLALGSLLLAIASFGTLLVSYRQTAAPRKRAQMRLLATGMVLAYVPFVVLTLVPATVTANSTAYVVGAQFSTLAFGAVPVALGYALLRYHLLVIDRHIRTTVTILVGGFCLALGAYLAFVFLFTGVLPTSSEPVLLWLGAILMASLIPLVWKFASKITERLFDPELTAVHRLLYEEKAEKLQSPPLLDAGKGSPLESVVHLLLAAARSVCQSSQVCFLSLQRESGTYHVMTLPRGEDSLSGPDGDLFRQVVQVIGGEDAGRQGWLDALAPAFAQLASARRPLLLSEIRSRHEPKPTGRFSRLLSSPIDDPLLVPVRGGQAGRQARELIGVLVLGVRDERVPYAGPDFAAIELLLDRTSWQLDLALLDTSAQQHVRLLSTLYSATGTAFMHESSSVEDLADVYAAAAAAGVDRLAGVEIWLVDLPGGLLRRVVHHGAGPTLPQEVMRPRPDDWSAWFNEGSADDTGEQSLSPRLSILSPPFPFAWLPLKRGDQQLGVLILTYPYARRIFSLAEQNILEGFADQLAVAFSDARTIAALRSNTAARRAQEGLEQQETHDSLLRLRGHVMNILRFAQGVQPGNMPLPPGQGSSLQATEVLALGGATSPEIAAALRVLQTTASDCLAALEALADPQERETGQLLPGLDRNVRAQVNEILGSFELGTIVLIITADRDYRDLLDMVLSLEGYSPFCVPTCRHATEWVQRRYVEGLRPPAVVLLDSQAPETLSPNDFAHSVREQWPGTWPLAHVMIFGVENHLPFTTSVLLEHVEISLNGSQGPPPAC
jgi:hypothetical protein